jgi:hypothetical protein
MPSSRSHRNPWAALRVLLAGDRAGSASGALSTTQQIGFALGVAITGVIYVGAADDGIGHAFELSLVQLAIVSAGIVVVSRLLPAPRRVRGQIEYAAT